MAPKPEEKPKTRPKAAGKQGDYRPRLMDRYSDTVIPYMIEKFGYGNPNMVPKLDKISLNVRVGNAKDEPKDLEMALDDLTTISGQKAVVTKAKKAIANFKIREGDPVGGRVTIRGKRMYEFLDRMISIAIPRVRDFNGLRQKSFDGFGNFSWGVKEQIIFPEIDYDKVEKIRGLDITIVTTANTDEEGFELLKAFGMPFRVHTEESEA
ncbi:MAG: 50S ribosomal protein L5 [Candidatus Marinimicrobia bacterium]|nr:50S ribosomal protein L5 [Candidatus Neomarinimicrobiota bacterium]